MPIEIEQKYEYPRKDLDLVLQTIARHYHMEWSTAELIDMRYDITTNKYGGKDFKRVRVCQDSSGTAYLLTHKYTDAHGVRQEDESSISRAQCNAEVVSKEVSYLKKVRYSLHAHVDFEGKVVPLTFDMDVLSADPLCYLEIEVIEANDVRRDQLLVLFDSVLDTLSLDLAKSTKSMLDMSIQKVIREESDIAS